MQRSNPARSMQRVPVARREKELAAPLQISASYSLEAAMGTKTNWTKAIEDALDELETMSDEIRVKVHLAGMDAKTTWDEAFAPRLEQARKHAREATQSSKAAIDDTLEAFRRFAAAL